MQNSDVWFPPKYHICSILYQRNGFVSKTFFCTVMTPAIIINSDPYRSIWSLGEDFYVIFDLLCCGTCPLTSSPKEELTI
jgi:hypothetical protein